MDAHGRCRDNVSFCLECEELLHERCQSFEENHGISSKDRKPPCIERFGDFDYSDSDSLHNSDSSCDVAEIECKHVTRQLFSSTFLTSLFAAASLNHLPAERCLQARVSVTEAGQTRKEELAHVEHLMERVGGNSFGVIGSASENVPYQNTSEGFGRKARFLTAGPQYWHRRNVFDVIFLAEFIRLQKGHVVSLSQSAHVLCLIMAMLDVSHSFTPVQPSNDDYYYTLQASPSNGSRSPLNTRIVSPSLMLLWFIRAFGSHRQEDWTDAARAQIFSLLGRVKEMFHHEERLRVASIPWTSPEEAIFFELVQIDTMEDVWYDVQAYRRVSRIDEDSISAWKVDTAMDAYDSILRILVFTPPVDTQGGSGGGIGQSVDNDDINAVFLQRLDHAEENGARHVLSWLVRELLRNRRAFFVSRFSPERRIALLRLVSDRAVANELSSTITAEEWLSPLAGFPTNGKRSSHVDIPTASSNAGEDILLVQFLAQKCHNSVHVAHILENIVPVPDLLSALFQQTIRVSDWEYPIRKLLGTANKYGHSTAWHHGLAIVRAFLATHVDDNIEV